MAAKEGDSSRRRGRAQKAREHTPVSSSGVVVRQPRRPGDSTRPDAHSRTLQPYRARLDVEMDDTAVSKVRDPSVSLRLDPEHGLVPVGTPPAPRSRHRRKDALMAIAAGVVFGVVLVNGIVLLARALGH